MLLFPLIVQAEGLSVSTANRILIALEQAKICEEQLVTASESNAEVQKQLEIVRSSIKLLEEQLVIYKSMVEMLNKIQETKDNAYEQAIKDAKPSFMDNLQKYLTGIGIGGIAVGILLL